MKKIILIMVMAIASLGVYAQNENAYVGGSVGFWRNSGDNTTEFKILPEIGYNLNDNLAIGAVLGYDYNYQNSVKVNIFEINPYARYSFYKNDKFAAFVDGRVGIGLGWAKYKNGGDSDTAVTYQIGLAPGVSYNLCDNVSIVAHVGFIGYQGGNNASQAPDEGGILLNGNDLTFGIYYNF